MFDTYYFFSLGDRYEEYEWPRCMATSDPRFSAIYQVWKGETAPVYTENYSSLSPPTTVCDPR